MKRDPLRQDKSNTIEFVRMLHLSGWTQAKAGGELGLTTGAISQFVGGISRPKSTVVRLFRLLLGERARGDSHIGASRFFERPLLPLEDHELDIIVSLRTLDPASRKEVLDGMKSIALAMAQANPDPAQVKPAVTPD